MQLVVILRNGERLTRVTGCVVALPSLPVTGNSKYLTLWLAISRLSECWSLTSTSVSATDALTRQPCIRGVCHYHFLADCFTSCSRARLCPFELRPGCVDWDSTIVSALSV